MSKKTNEIFQKYLHCEIFQRTNHFRLFWKSLAVQIVRTLGKMKVEHSEFKSSFLCWLMLFANAENNCQFSAIFVCWFQIQIYRIFNIFLSLPCITLSVFFSNLRMLAINAWRYDFYIDNIRGKKCCDSDECNRFIYSGLNGMLPILCGYFCAQYVFIHLNSSIRFIPSRKGRFLFHWVWLKFDCIFILFSSFRNFIA